VRKARRKFPQLLTVRELDAMDVDGYVSMLGWSFDSIRTYSPRRIIAPLAMTVTEAFQQVGAGAHFAKISGDNLNLVRTCRRDASFDFCPIFVTGGMNLSAIPEAIEAGAVLVGAGFDLMLKGKPAGIRAEEIAEILREYVRVAREARNRKWPALADAAGKPWNEWLNSLPHHHPF